MSNYEELYKKYRPQDWDDIVGQDSVINGLRTAVVENNIPTGYLFAGKQHGSGKTSSALVLAKALNCENLQENGNPCNECSICKNIDNGTQVGVEYVAMANRSSVDDVREIINRSQMAQPINKKVWILDECHRMSTAAQEAWLIPLEKTTNDSVFIFCSTEPEKILETVKSRLQVRTFSSIDTKTIVMKLAEINKKEKLGVDKEGIIAAAREANGGLRNAVTNLERIANGEKLSTSYRTQILSLLASKNFPKIFALTNEMEKEGQDFKVSAEQLFRDLSDLLIISAGGKNDLSNTPGLVKFAQSVGPAKLLMSTKAMGDQIGKMANNAIDKRILFEMALVDIIGILNKGGN